MAGAARLGVRRLDAALAQWEKGVAGFRARRVKAGSARGAAEGERVLLPDGDDIRIERLKVPDEFEVVWSPEGG